MALLRSGAAATNWLEWDRQPKPAGMARWGLPWVESAIGRGPVPGTTVVVGARTNVGKGWFTLELLRGMAESGPVVYLSLEDPLLEVGRRMAQAGYEHPNLYVDFPDPGNVLRAFDAAVREVKPVAIGVDYLQCMGFDVERLTGAINGLRERTRQHNIVSVVASQCNRPAPGTSDHGVPPTERLKGAGAIEERADVIFMLGNGKDRTLLVELAKVKGGPVGARARYRRAEGGRLVQVQTRMEDDE